MKIIRILAESGGTKTDWLLLDEHGNWQQFTTQSYHPLKLLPEFVVKETLFWDQFNLSNSQLDFFGAGCLKGDNQQLVKDALQQMGFHHVNVQSDLFAAAKSFTQEVDYGAICGTGSVVFKIKEDQLLELRGGLGWELGDEGSGYYFGKLVLQKLKVENGCPSEIINHIASFKTLDELWKNENDASSKYDYAKLAHILHPFYENQWLKAIHKENIELFFEKYLQNVNSVSFVGSYAFYHQSLFREIAQNKGIVIKEFVARPIEKLKEKMS